MSRDLTSCLWLSHTLPKKSLNEYGKSISNDIHWKSHIEWMWAHPFNVDFPHWINEWMWEIHIDLTWSHSLNIELSHLIVVHWPCKGTFNACHVNIILDSPLPRLVQYVAKNTDLPCIKGQSPCFIYLPVGVVWCGFSILIQWFICQSVFSACMWEQKN